jgi:LmbE family N-acetylglucosaminyl deacetylase
VVAEFERALVVFAHPDDAEFTCGGTIAAWTRDGTDVSYVCVTDGSAGWNGPDLGREEIARIREEELREAAAILEVETVVFLGYPDGSLEPTLDLRRALTREVRRFRPDVIVAPDPSALWSKDRTYINHPDHRAVGEAMLAVVAVDSPTRPQFPELLGEGLEPHKVRTLWLPLWAADGDTRVDISETIDLKVKAVRTHRSQMENMGEFDIDAKLREYATRVGAHGGLQYAEAFRTFKLGWE